MSTRTSPIWQPEFTEGVYDFKVRVDVAFAKSMLEAKLDVAKRDRMNELGKDLLKGRGSNYPVPYLFHEDTALVTQFSSGDDGRWLASPHAASNCNGDRPLTYDSHNLRSSHDTWLLLQLVDQWAKYADILREK